VKGTLNQESELAWVIKAMARKGEGRAETGNVKCNSEFNH